jgi:hypothetical protein
MLSNNSNQPQASPLSDAKAGAADSVPFLKPGDPIEVASTGGGTITDPPAKDNRPPAAYASDSSLA